MTRKYIIGVVAILVIGGIFSAGSQISGADSCPACAVDTGAKSIMTKDEQRVIHYVCDQFAAGKASFTAADIEKAPGISLKGLSEAKIRSGGLAELSSRNIESCGVEGQGYCAQFNACSVDRNLNGASGEELERYQLEKSQDGMMFQDWAAPDFTLSSTAGTQVSLTDYKGKPVALVLMSGHCHHSLATLPILSKLNEKYGGQGLVVLPVYVNSGLVEDVKDWSSKMNLSMPLIVSDNNALSKAYHSRIVPSIFLINAEGFITKKLVGLKGEAILDQNFEELIQKSQADS
ncbi:MAG: TlpA disulfide reductase family protein [bacterium]|nr:TlpA disulfide reductase family protein [bacterium]